MEYFLFPADQLPGYSFPAAAAAGTARDTGTFQFRASFDGSPSPGRQHNRPSNHCMYRYVVWPPGPGYLESQSNSPVSLVRLWANGWVDWSWIERQLSHPRWLKTAALVWTVKRRTWFDLSGRRSVCAS